VRLEAGYHDREKVPYHCREHAAHVLQGMHVILTRGQLLEGSLDPVTHLACLLAAVGEPWLSLPTLLLLLLLGIFQHLPWPSGCLIAAIHCMLHLCTGMIV
jgi:hypothetical protein